MYNKLLELSKKSYSPYSKFKVSSIVVTNDNKEYSGVNVENSSFGASLCAERNAISNCVTKGVKKDQIKEIHIMGYNSDFEKDFFISPCGICRQVIIEMMNPDCKVFLYNKFNKEKKFLLVKELIPFPFTGEELEK